MTKVLICGGRGFNDARLFSEVMRTVCDFPVTQIIQGGASGADRMAVHWAMDRAIQVKEYLPEWAHGRKAGPIRNQRMLDEGKPELVIAFPGGKGTADMVRRAKKAGVRVIEVPNLCGLAKV